MLLRKLYTILLILACTVSAKAQFTDAFTDGNFSSSPAWGGHTGRFRVNPALKLQLYDTFAVVSPNSYLSTASAAINNATWEFKVEFGFNPSSANLARIYVVSDQSILNGPLNGYFVMVGNTEDEVSLYRQTGTTVTEIIDGLTGKLNTATVNVGIKVTRDSVGNWALYSDAAGGTAYALEGTTTNNLYSSTSWFGVYCLYSATRDSLFWFDNFNITGTAFMDTVPPAVTSISAVSATGVDVVFSEKMDPVSAQIEANYSAAPALGPPTAAILDAADSTLVHLTWGTPFTTCVTYTLTVSAAVQDKAGNGLTTPATGTFAWATSAVASPLDVVINEIFADPDPLVTSLPDAEFVELYNASGLPFDLAGWTFKDGSVAIATLPSYILCPDAYVILVASGDEALYSGYGPVLGISLPALNNTGDQLGLRDNFGTLVDSVAYTDAWYQDAIKKTGGWTLERINPWDTCDIAGNWIASVAAIGGTPGTQNSVFDTLPDLTPPALVSITLIDSVTVEVCFDETMNNVPLSTVSNYGIAPALGISSATAQPGNMCVRLTLSAPATPGIIFTLTISGLEDCAGNPSGTLSGTFVRGGSAAPGEVLINEIFPDPSPVVGLPAAEFVELYNHTSKAIDVGGWKLTDQTTVATLPAYTLMPDQYLILCPVADVPDFVSFGSVLGLPSWPSLNNSGDSLEIQNSTGVVIDSAYYALSWYHDASKDDGGWSLERINPFDTCDIAGNWAASTDPAGGTPGNQNSIFDTLPDLTAPVLLSVGLLDSVTVQVCFDEAMDAVLLSTIGNYSISPAGITVTAATVLPGNTCVNLTLSAPAALGVIYTITMSGLTDCAGNPAGTLSDDFVRGGVASYREVLINEIFPDPSPVIALPAAEYVELYNHSAKALDLTGWQITDQSSTGTLPAFTLLANDYVILCAAADVADFLPFGDVIGLATFPSLNNTGDSLEILNASGVLMDAAYYTLSWYHDATKDDGGWSLERINPSDTCDIAGNWAASVDLNGGTPGTQNSVFDTLPDTTAPLLVSVGLLDSLHVEVCFDEAMDVAQLTALANYFVTPSLGAPVAAVPASGNTCVVLTLSAPAAVGVIYTLTMNNLEDCTGNPAGTLTGTFVRGVAGGPEEIIIHEIFADPSPVVGLPGTEFVEIYNRTPKAIDLTGWEITDRSSSGTLGAYTILPGAYLILCATSDVTDYLPFGSTLGVPGFPSLNNAGDSLELRDSSGTLIDFVYYSDDWYDDGVKQDGGWTLELIDPNDTCDITGNWTASVDPAGGTPGKLNSVFSTLPDLTPPNLISTMLLDSVTLQLCFDESMNIAQLGTASNYNISPALGAPLAAVPSPDKACVVLTLSAPATIGVIYTVTISNMEDCAGNIPGTLTTQFARGTDALPGEVVINEIFPDPSPVVGMPEEEFIEIVNSSANAIDLTGWTLTDRTTTIATFGNYTLLPGEYLILCANAAATDYAVFGDVLGLSNFPSLNNASDSLELYDGKGVLMDFVYYTDDWYGDDTKKDGGYTLERKDATFLCSNSGNWGASTDAGGGTPGVINSIAGTFVDSIPPGVVSAYASTSMSVVVDFTEPVNTADLSNTANYVIDNGIGAPVLATPGLAGLSVELILSAPLDSNTVYCVTVSNLRDCPGLPIASDNIVCFGVPVPAQSGDLILNEILFNPYTGGSDYVEIYNISDKIIDMRTIYIGEKDPGADSIYNSDQISSDGFLLLPMQYLCITPDKAVQISTYQPADPDAILEMSSFPSYDDDEGICVIWTDSGTVLDQFHYLDDYHFPNLDDKEGVSLERLYFTRPTQDPMNWHSAATTVRYGTPGYENSQALDIDSSGTQVWADPETFSPDSDGDQDVVSIHYHFTEPGYNARVAAYDRLGHRIKTIAQNTLLGTEPGLFTWDGTDDAGHKAPVGIYVILFEVVNPNNGKTDAYKVGVVLAARF